VHFLIEYESLVVTARRCSQAKNLLQMPKLYLSLNVGRKGYLKGSFTCFYIVSLNDFYSNINIWLWLSVFTQYVDKVVAVFFSEEDFVEVGVISVSLYYKRA
jgi:hypothetical protein